MLQLSVLLTALRDLRPRVLHLAGHPAQPAEAARPLLSLVDGYVPDHFAWYWKFSPAVVARTVIEPRWRAERRALFSQYDAVVCAPGPYLAEYDARAPSALSDITTAAGMGLPVVLSSHSIGPLSSAALGAVSQASVRVARESRTHQYLRDRGISCTLAADLAFLYPYPRTAAGAPVARPYRVVFLRSNNVSARALRIEGDALLEGARVVADASPHALILATSDYARDARFLSGAARRLGVPWVGCRTIAELVGLIAGSSGVVSDRYHPAICAAVLGKPAQVLPNREPHKMHGLKDLLSDRSVEDLQELARTGLDAVREGLRRAV